MMFSPRNKIVYSSQANKKYTLKQSELKLKDISASTNSNQMSKDSASSDEASQSSFQMIKSAKAESCNEKKVTSQKYENEAMKRKLKSYRSLEYCSISDLQTQKIEQASVVTKTTFRRYIGSMENAKARLQQFKDKIQKQRKIPDIKLTVQYIATKEYLTASQKILIQTLNQTLEKLTNSQGQKQKLFKQRFELESQLRMVRGDMLKYQQRLKWYEAYSEEKDFQAKALYWKQYFKDLNLSQQKCANFKKILQQ